MSHFDIIFEKIHHRHDSHWSGSVSTPNGSDMVLCVACAIEMMADMEMSFVRKAVVLGGVAAVLTQCPGALNMFLQQDRRVCVHFISTLLGTLQAKEPTLQEQVIQVLVGLLLELNNETFVGFVLDEIQTQLCQESSVQGFLPTFIFLGKLLDAIPSLCQSLAVTYVPLLEQLSLALLFPDEALKSSVCYVFRKVCVSMAASQALPQGLRERLCALLLQTLQHACSSQLIINCLGFLKELVKLGEVVSLLMTCGSNHCQDSLSQCSTQLTVERCSLPLILKKLLLSGDETLQVASAHCMASVLVHSPSRYCAHFIQADIPEFLCECLCSRSEVLLWSVYSCLLLLVEEPLFFSHCHSVYGIEPLIRSLTEVLTLNNVEVQKQGLLLLAKILERQPDGVSLFPSAPRFVAAAEVVRGGSSSSCLKVAMQAVSAATALLRVNHQPNPVQYDELKKLVDAVVCQCTELPLPTATHCRTARRTGTDNSSQAFLLQALIFLQSACRLAELCRSEPQLRENAFTAPEGQDKDSLWSFCFHLLHCCDTACIPTVTRHCEKVPSAPILQHFFSILSSQFSLLPSLMPPFASKLASSGFFRLTLEHKAAFCAGNRNPLLNAACCDFLQRLSICLLSQLDVVDSIRQQTLEECEELLHRCLPSLYSRPSEWPPLLCRGEWTGSEGQICATQYCLLIILQLALQHGDRLLSSSTLSSCVVAVLGDSCPPPSVLRAALYLLSETQDGSPDLELASLSCINKAFSSVPSFSLLYIHHPSLLLFLFHYAMLAELFGPAALELWLTHKPKDEIEQKSRISRLLPIIERHPTAVLSLLGLLCAREPPLSHNALQVLSSCLQGRPQYSTAVSALLQPSLLQVLQRIAVQIGEEPQASHALPLVLQLLCLIQTGVREETDIDGTDFKLLFHVSILAGRLKSCDVESLLPAFNYLYCSLALCPPSCSDRAVSTLLCNGSLVEQLQTALDSHTCPQSHSMSSSLTSCARLLVSSLLTLQPSCNTEVQKSISLSLDDLVQLLAFRKGQTVNLLLASTLRLLQTALDLDLRSPLLTLADSGVVLQDSESSLHPLGSHRARCLVAALHGLVLQKEDLLLNASVCCLVSLMGFLHRRSPPTALHVIRQPGSRFLLFSLLSSGETCTLHPGILVLLTLLVRYGGQDILSEKDLGQVLDLVEQRSVMELGGDTAQALEQLLTEVPQLTSATPPCLPAELKRRVQTLLETLGSLTLPEDLPVNILHIGGLCICLSDFTPYVDKH